MSDSALSAPAPSKTGFVLLIYAFPSLGIFNILSYLLMFINKKLPPAIRRQFWIKIVLSDIRNMNCVYGALFSALHTCNTEILIDRSQVVAY